MRIHTTGDKLKIKWNIRIYSSRMGTHFVICEYRHMYERILSTEIETIP